MQQDKYITTTMAGEILGLDRTQVFRLIKAGKIPAIRIGRNYLINKEDLGISEDGTSKKDIKNVGDTVTRMMDEYGDVIKKLGEE